MLSIYGKTCTYLNNSQVPQKLSWGWLSWLVYSGLQIEEKLEKGEKSVAVEIEEAATSATCAVL